ncbi:MAG TPA: glycyl-radical enzyme activating protein [Tenuifilaceae bacterium]|nr:glycyl-radical enzyme activating protein [Tenuifilaceae bacterium]HPJ44871.1 glycyl-radical enzyme activating protein [Tenuifilaceae bacterium]HPQ33162.1 glycyl-radical enzyme activating protein [Tenuifilaceae bacterium]HRX67096.1 glycyl-radical enzyme activating protein [Tenuifilaceae bacterium]
MSEGIIFNIRNFSVHDGPGIRTTVFLKGCPLNCKWCHNPESQRFDIERFEKIKNLGSRSFVSLENVGKKYTVAKVLDEVTKDTPFFEESGGGITLSGGEPLAQPEFTIELLRVFKSLGINTALDTCGYAPWKVVEKTIPLTDVFLYDIKIIDNQEHINQTGVSNRLILENLKQLAESAKTIHIRIPLVEGITDSENNLQAIINVINNLKSVKRIDLLPYHTLAKHKFHKFYGKYSLEYLNEYPKIKSQEILKKFLGVAPLVSLGG